MATVIANGVPWYDQHNNPVNAKAGCLIKVHDTFHLFGEYKTDDVNHFIGFSHYTSVDLATWRYEGLALPLQKSGLLGPNRIGERVKVLKNPNTNQFVMLMHTDDLGYRDPYIGVAVTDDLAHPFTFLGPLLYQNQPVRKWDMGTFVDQDGTAYLLTHEGNIYRLAADYQAVVECVAENIAVGGESPAMFHQGNYYFALFSNKTSWERNDNYYLTATNIHGPWHLQGTFCPRGSLTYNSQCSFVFPLATKKGVIPMYMGDRWSFPKQAASATQVWLPLSVNADHLSIPHYWENWDWQQVTPVKPTSKVTPLSFTSNQTQQTIVLNFTGRGIIVSGSTTPHGGYGQFILKNANGQQLQNTTIDFYSLVASTGQRYISPKLPEGHYQLIIKTTGEHGVWFDKAGHRFGSDDFFVTLSGYQILDQQQNRKVTQ
ncbi:MAG: family 43 glycosylhydrolase [Lactobacillus sp.]|jgi:hypothetical protein|nr:family 43 glycosylhydrolase [Lactobacillus sp.]